MTEKKSNDNRRKLLKSLAAGSGAVVAGKSLPESWSKPIVDTVVLSVHAETSPGATVAYSQAQGFEHTGQSSTNSMPDQTLTFTLGGVTPTGNGTVNITNLAGDLGIGNTNYWILKMGSTTIGQTAPSVKQCEVAADSKFDVSLANLLAAVSGDTIEIIAENNNGSIQILCGPDGKGGGESNRMDVTLAFPALA